MKTTHKIYIVTVMFLLIGNQIFCQTDLPCENETVSINSTLNQSLHTLINPVESIDPNDIPNFGGSSGSGNNGLRENIVYFVHGLSGGASSWHGAAQFTDGTYPKAKTYRPVYSENVQSFWDASEQLQNETNDIDGFEYIEPEKRFIISHSQGGLVTRDLDWRYEIETPNAEERTFNGFITIGTPNDGAAILNDTDQIFNLANEGFEKLSTPWALEFIEEALDGTIWNVFAELFSIDEIFENAAENAISTVSDIAAFDLLPLFFNNFLTPITELYDENSIKSNGFYNHDSSFPHAAFYGVEDEPEFFRYLTTFKGEQANEYTTPFSMNNDQELVNYADEQMDIYYSNYQLWGEWNGETCAWWEWMIPPLVPYCSILEFLSNAEENDAEEISLSFQRGFYYLSQLNNRWLSIIGATEQINIQQVCNCEIEDEYSGNTYSYSYNVDDPSECDEGTSNDGLKYCYMTTDFDINLLPSDGVVPVHSQIALPGVSAEGGTLRAMPGANHSQERNSPMTRDALLSIFEGDLDVSFKIIE